ncbi:hypothetical protein GOP47_0015694 [Adiantum capillus-veneris]|uniref:Glycosyltransferase 61 catalytic domain-containing protein n=1 Tax=Adiantum capillus-veneris TaxID=13818 RepID=A0A9D4ULA3_ADICA|nr:hypothetical protein GOP47_0015694 [Adiantum capillus-veneris]
MIFNIRSQKSQWSSLDGSKRSGCAKRHHRRTWYTRTSTMFVVALLVFLLMSATQFILPTNPPYPDLPQHAPCSDDPQGYVLEDMGICTNTCGKICFPRVHGLCFHHTKVVLCDGQPPLPEHIIQASSGLPSIMRFYMEKPRMKVPVVHKACPGWNSSTLRPTGMNSARWIKGLQMVADLTLMPTGKVGPNPHHEAEKVVPAILFSQLSEFRNSSLYWFANPNDPLMISKWSLGLLDVFSKDLKVEYMPPVGKEEPPVCFEDAILFAGLTNSGYMPNVETHDWFRNRILEHCNVPITKANMPVRDVVIVHRPNSSRNIRNYEAVKNRLEAELQVPVKMAVPGPWSFCNQVKLVAEADIVLTPHGSQNANLLVVRPGSSIFEVFPLLYYIDWYKHYLHAGAVNFYELFGTWPLENGSMPLLMRLQALLYGWKNCFSELASLLRLIDFEGNRCMSLDKKSWTNLHYVNYILTAW